MTTALALTGPPTYDIHDGQPVQWAEWDLAPWVLCQQVGNPICGSCGSADRHAITHGTVAGVRRLTAFRCPACGRIDMYDHGRDGAQFEPVDVHQPAPAAGPGRLREVDWGATSKARANREKKARALENGCWHMGITPDQLSGCDAAQLRAIARRCVMPDGRQVNPPNHASPTWPLAIERLQARAAWAAANPDDPRARRTRLSERPDFLPPHTHHNPKEPSCPSPPHPRHHPAKAPIPRPRRASAATTAAAAPLTKDHARTATPNDAAATADRDIPHRAVPRDLWPNGWAHLAALGPVPSAATCTIPTGRGRDTTACGQPAIVHTPTRGGPNVWRCQHHPPIGNQWGARLNWAPPPGLVCRYPAWCMCGRCPARPLAPIPGANDRRHSARLS